MTSNRQEGYALGVLKCSVMVQATIVLSMRVVLDMRLYMTCNMPRYSTAFPIGTKLASFGKYLSPDAAIRTHIIDRVCQNA